MEPPFAAIKDLVECDRRHVWHPYGPMPGRMEPLVVESAAGVRLRLADGRELVDGMSSWWAAIHGYRHPVLDAAARDQLGRMSHVMFGGLTHEPAVRLCSRLVAIAPTGLEHVFLCDSGSVSVEVAVKMCLQYWRSRGRSAKRRLLTWRKGYHGDTFMAMSVCDPEGGMHAMWDGVVASQVFAPAPPADFDPWYASELSGLIARHADSLAAVIVEPVVQGAGGMRFHDPEYLRVLRSACSEHGVLLIFDEIATGFGRSGSLFAAGHAGVSPDVMCVGKALTGGYLSLAAALCTAPVAAGISEGAVPVLAHGPTFMGNPLACAVANASLDVLLGSERTYPHGWRAEVTRIEAGLRAGLAPVGALPGVADVRVLGAIGVVQLDREVDIAAATAAAVSAGVWLRPFRDLIYTMPPYVTSADDLALICEGVLAASTACVRLRRARGGREQVRRRRGGGGRGGVRDRLRTAREPGQVLLVQHAPRHGISRGPAGEGGLRKLVPARDDDQVAEPAAAQHPGVSDQADVREHRADGGYLSPGVRELASVGHVGGEQAGAAQYGPNGGRELRRGHAGGRVTRREHVRDDHVERAGPERLDHFPRVADANSDASSGVGASTASPERQVGPDELDERGIVVHGQLPGAGTGRRDVPGQCQRPGAKVQDAQRRTGRRRGVDHVAQPPDVLELQVLRVIEINVRLRHPVGQKRPGLRPVPVTHQIDAHIRHYRS